MSNWSKKLLISFIVFILIGVVFSLSPFSIKEGFSLTEVLWWPIFPITYIYWMLGGGNF